MSQALETLYKTDMIGLPLDELLMVLEEVAVTELDEDLIKWKLGMCKASQMCIYHEISRKTLHNRLNDFKARCAAKAQELNLI